MAAPFQPIGGPRPQFRQPGTFYIFQPRPPPASAFLKPGEFMDGKRMRKGIARKTVDYNSAICKMLTSRRFHSSLRDTSVIQPDPAYYTMMQPPMNMADNPTNCVTTKFVRSAQNKVRCPIFCVCWTPEGRRLITGNSSGEFTLWNGLTFNFETITQSHDVAIKTMLWSKNENWMVSGDQNGYIKYWQSNMNNVKMFEAHKDPVRSISFCPTDTKFVSGSDDGTARIWDFMRCHCENILRGHGADVKAVDWHPTKGLVATGSKDSQQPVKLWDPKTGQSLVTLHAHKSTVTDLEWNRNGNWLLTGSRDHLIKVFDIRNMSTEMQTFRGHKKEVSCVAWHPIHEDLFASGGSDGSLMFWLTGADKEVGCIEQAHDSIIWDLSWHPLGHILVSGSNDHATKFWTRNRPGDKMRDKYNLNLVSKDDDDNEDNEDESAAVVIPGLGDYDEEEENEDQQMDSQQQQQQYPQDNRARPGFEPNKAGWERSNQAYDRDGHGSGRYNNNQPQSNNRDSGYQQPRPGPSYENGNYNREEHSNPQYPPPSDFHRSGPPLPPPPPNGTNLIPPPSIRHLGPPPPFDPRQAPILPPRLPPPHDPRHLQGPPSSFPPPPPPPPVPPTSAQHPDPRQSSSTGYYQPPPNW